MFVELNGIAIELNQIPENWHVTDANPGDWKYSIENGTYWGIRPTLSEALAAAKSDIVQLKEDFNFTSDDLAREWQVRHNIDVYLGNNDSCEF